MLRAPAPRRFDRPAAAGRAARRPAGARRGDWRGPRSRRAVPGDRPEAAAHRRLPDPRHLRPRRRGLPGSCPRRGLRDPGAWGLPAPAGRGHRRDGRPHPRGRVRAGRVEGPALRLVLPGRRGRAGAAARPPGPPGGRAEHRGARSASVHAGGTHGASGARLAPGGRDRERDALPRDALVRRPARDAARDRQGDLLDPRARRAAAAPGRDRAPRGRLRDLRDPAARRGPPGAGAAQGGQFRLRTWSARA